LIQVNLGRLVQIGYRVHGRFANALVAASRHQTINGMILAG
jgi:hypothetical protein